MTMEDRLAALEHSNRWLRAVAVGLTVAVVVLVYVGRRNLPLLGSRTVEARKIDARRVVIRDGEGRRRLTLGTLGDGSVTLRATGPGGESRLMIGTRPDGGAGVQVNDRKGRKRLLIGTNGKKAAGLRVLDQEEVGRIEAMTRGEKAAVVHRGAGGGRRAETLTNSDGEVVTRMKAAGGPSRVEMGVTAKGKAGVTVMDGAGTSRLSLTVSPTGMAFFSGCDPSGDRCFLAGTRADGGVRVHWPRDGSEEPET